MKSRVIVAASILRICERVLRGPRSAEGEIINACHNPIFYEDVIEICKQVINAKKVQP